MPRWQPNSALVPRACRPSVAAGRPPDTAHTAVAAPLPGKSARGRRVGGGGGPFTALFPSKTASSPVARTEHDLPWPPRRDEESVPVAVGTPRAFSNSVRTYHQRGRRGHWLPVRANEMDARSHKQRCASGGKSEVEGCATMGEAYQTDGRRRSPMGDGKGAPRWGVCRQGHAPRIGRGLSRPVAWRPTTHSCAGGGASAPLGTGHECGRLSGSTIFLPTPSLPRSRVGFLARVSEAQTQSPRPTKSTREPSLYCHCHLRRYRRHGHPSPRPHPHPPFSPPPLFC